MFLSVRTSYTPLETLSPSWLLDDTLPATLRAEPCVVIKVVQRRAEVRE